MTLRGVIHLVALEPHTASTDEDGCKINICSSFLRPKLDSSRNAIVLESPRLSDRSEPIFDLRVARSHDLTLTLPSKARPLEWRKSEDISDVRTHCASSE